ncbi:hypothetical protein NUH87_04385 [Pseudomonas batumici]|uniref:hypothetical protein n=1 Tax=Pseudomonas batumici TaxID=226910 RepID=UPI0030CF8279
MHVKSLIPLSCACLDLTRMSAADSSPAIAHKAIHELDLSRTRIKATISTLAPQVRA